MPHSEQSLTIRWAERAALLVLVLYLCVHTMPRAWKSLVTDFPNYYLAAQLVHQGFDASRMYEWQWLEREKDHRAIPIRVIGLVPITPFSTLFMVPLTGLKPLAAKRAWIFDVMVAPERRGRRLGEAVVRLLLGHPAVRSTRRVYLGTRDAQAFYARLGFGDRAELETRQRHHAHTEMILIRA